MDPPDFHTASTLQQVFAHCHRLLASVADQDEAEGDHDGICVQAELCLYLLPSHTKIHFPRPNSPAESLVLLLTITRWVHICIWPNFQHLKTLQFQSLWSARWLVYLFHPSSTHHPIKMSENAEHADKNVEIWKVKKLIKSLEAARGNGTSMISLIIPPGDQACISRVSKMLADEYGTASNIKSRVNRLVLLVLKICDKSSECCSYTFDILPFQAVCAWCNHVCAAPSQALHQGAIRNNQMWAF